MIKCCLVLVGLFLSTAANAQSGDEKFVEPKASKEVKELITDARRAFSKDSQNGIAEMKKVVAYCKKQEYDSINFFDANYHLAILYYQIPEMDSAMLTFRTCLRIAERKKSHYFYYKSYLGFNRVNSYLGFYDSAIYYTEEGLKHSMAIDYKKAIANNYNQLGVLAGHKGDNIGSAKYKEKSLEIAQELQDSMSIFYAAYNLAIHYQSSKQYQKSLEYSIYVQNIARETGHNFYISLANSVTSQVYMELDDYEKALSYVNVASEAQLRAIENAESEAHPQWIAFMLLNKGIIYNRLDSTAKARSFIKKAILYYDSTNRLESRAASYATYSDSYRLDGNYDSALYYAKIARNLGDASGHNLEELTGNLCLAKSYYAVANEDSASFYATRAIKIAERDGYYSRVEEAAEILFNVYDKKGNTDRALYYLKQLSAARDTLENEDRVKNVTKLSMQFEFDKEKRELKFSQEKESLVLNQQISRQKAIQYGAFGGILLLSFAVYGFYSRFRNKQRDHLKISEQASELQKKHQLLNELSRYKEGLSHMIVHDMKNPLNVILGLTEEKLPDQEDTQFINQSGKMILQLANNIMDIQKFEEAKMQLEKSVYHLHEIVHYAEQQVSLLMKTKSMFFENDFEENLKVFVDLGIMSRVLVNLFTNAIKYSPSGSSIRISIKEDEAGFYELSISDNGQGIEASQLPYVFDKFWQVYAKKSGHTYSTGLGLTFCKLAMEAHEGAIRVVSSVGEGATFILSIPTSNQQVNTASIEGKSWQQMALVENKYSDEDLFILGAIIKKVRNIPLYKAGKIEKILNQESYDSEKIKDWIRTVKQAVLNWDQQRFDELTRSDESTAPPTGSD